jgi:hypothetical protein
LRRSSPQFVRSLRSLVVRKQLRQAELVLLVECRATFGIVTLGVEERAFVFVRGRREKCGCMSFALLSHY